MRKDQNATFASIPKLMKNRVDEPQVAKNIKKIRHTKSGDVLAQLPKGSNAKDIKDAVQQPLVRKLQSCNAHKE